jgi:hypothetical protein
MLSRQITRETSQYSTSIHIWPRQEMMWEPATRGNSGHWHLQVGFGLAKVLVMADGCKHLPLVPKITCSNLVIESCFWYFSFKPIPGFCVALYTHTHKRVGNVRFVHWYAAKLECCGCTVTYYQWRQTSSSALYNVWVLTDSHSEIGHHAWQEVAPIPPLIVQLLHILKWCKLRYSMYFER